MGRARNRRRRKAKMKGKQMLVKTHANGTIPVKSAVTPIQKPAPQPCHVGPKKVFQINNAWIWAGSQKELRDDWNWDLMVRLLDLEGRDFPVSVKMNDEAEALLPPELKVVGYTPPILDVTWPDYGRPALDEVWWQKLHAFIATMPEGSDVVFHCYGGHGRTGTALAILAGISFPDRNPVEFIRSAYCKTIVESKAQVSYIKAITGLKFKAEPHFGSQYYYKGGNSYVPAGKQWWEKQYGKGYEVDMKEGVLPDDVMPVDTYMKRGGPSVDYEEGDYVYTDASTGLRYRYNEAKETFEEIVEDRA